MRTTLIVAVLVAGFAIAQALWIPISSGSPPDRRDKYATDYRGEHQSQPKSSDERIADFTEQLATWTGILGGATILLFVATGLLWNETRKGGKLARQEFIASHRPKVIVRAVRTPILSDHYVKAKAGDTEQRMRWVFLDLANTGDSDAEIVGLELDYGVPRDEKDWSDWEPEPTGTAKVEPTAPVVLKAGEQKRFEITSATLRLGEGRNKAAIRGIIRYSDARKVVRVTALYRRWSIDAASYTPSKDSAEEYED